MMRAMGEKAPEVALLGSDLLMASRLGAVLGPLGVTVVTAARADRLPAASLVFVDLNQGPVERIEAIGWIRACHPESRVIGFCDHDEKELRRRAIAAGASEVVANRHLATAARRLSARLGPGS